MRAGTGRLRTVRLTSGVTGSRNAKLLVLFSLSSIKSIDLSAGLELNA